MRSPEYSESLRNMKAFFRRLLCGLEGAVAKLRFRIPRILREIWALVYCGTQRLRILRIILRILRILRMPRPFVTDLNSCLGYVVCGLDFRHMPRSVVGPPGAFACVSVLHLTALSSQRPQRNPRSGENLGKVRPSKIRPASRINTQFCARSAQKLATYP